MQLCFFSDKYASNLLPLTLTRPIDDLRIGILTIKEKWLKHLKVSSISRLIPEYQKAVFSTGKIDPHSSCVWLNSRYIPNHDVITSIHELKDNEAITNEDEVIAIRLPGKDSKDFLHRGIFNTDSMKFASRNASCSSIKYFWDMLALNASEIEADISLLSLKPGLGSKKLNSCIIENEKRIFVSEEAFIEPGCILNADKGSIFIGPKAILESGSIIKGPVAICEGATTKMASRIYDGTTIGPVCKVGGEVTNSIFHSYSNKGHDGFVGNSLIGQWCNFGADSNTSNLKNNYSLVRLPNWETKELHESGVQFFGTVLGDHSKTSINSMLNTGTLCGVSSNIFMSGFSPKYISSFSWLSDNGVQIYDFEKAINAMKAMMNRRGVELTGEYQTMMKKVFNMRES